jgi:acetyl-CoA carboxylase biotin carboxylase subunit
MFKKVLIANRGEIAVRIAQTLHEMGISVVGVYSDPDRAAPHVSRADEAYPLEGITSGETYLRIDRIIGIAQQCGADAIHPGYGFLSENAEFAQACADAGITFIGPKPDAIRAMGDKVIAKRIMEKAGVPVVPGWSSDANISIARLRREAETIGYPALIKAAASGGGKGMRVVERSEDLDGALEAAQREANAAFGDARVFLEKYLPRARHVEIQILGDSRGRVIHLFERECSIQRRHQKIIEEAPSPALDDDLRQRMGEAAVRAAEAIGYENAGTVEFMLDETGDFYFLEVNTRLQVEHPVTEMTVNCDLVRAQVMVAAGESLPYTEGDIYQSGHAIECRIYAEDANRDFLPSTGEILLYDPPLGSNIRVDSGVERGSVVSVNYDPMLAKVIAWGWNRNEAITRMLHALRNFVIMGVTTNIDFLREVMSHEAFRAGDLHTRFLDEHRIIADRDDRVSEEALIVAALTVSGRRRAEIAGSGENDRMTGSAAGPWETAGVWRAV